MQHNKQVSTVANFVWIFLSIFVCVFFQRSKVVWLLILVKV